MKLLRSVQLILTQAATSVVGCPAARHEGHSTPPTLPSWQVAGQLYAYRKGGISPIQTSLRTPRPFAVYCLPSSLLLCS